MGEDYSSPTITFINLPTFNSRLRQCIDIPIIDDDVNEVAEVFQVLLTRDPASTPDNVEINPSTAIITIQDDDGKL